MKFLCSIWLPPWAMFILSGLMIGKGPAHGPAAALGAMGLFWLWIDVPLTFAYVLYRIFFRAKRDAQAYSQPNQWQPPR
jgi:hypothetical protein